MDTKKLEKWANLLLDTGKRNNLIHFKDTKSSTVEVVLPDISSTFEKAESEVSFEVRPEEKTSDWSSAVCSSDHTSKDTSL